MCFTKGPDNGHHLYAWPVGQRADCQNVHSGGSFAVAEADCDARSTRFTGSFGDIVGLRCSSLRVAWTGGIGFCFCASDPRGPVFAELSRWPSLGRASASTSETPRSFAQAALRSPLCFFRAAIWTNPAENVVVVCVCHNSERAYTEHTHTLIQHT